MFKQTIVLIHMPEQNEERAALAARLKEMREYLSLSQEEVSEMLGIPRSASLLVQLKAK